MNVLVVGGAGYLGGAVTDLLMASDHKVRVYDSLLYEEDYRKPVDFIFGDIRESKKLIPHLEWADVVVWLAGIVGDGACVVNYNETKQVNEDIIRWLTDTYKGRIIYPSSCSIYGAQDNILDENSMLNPLSLYAKTKVMAETYLDVCNALIFRLGTLFGLGDSYSRLRLDLVVNTLTAQAQTRGEISVYGGEQYRPLLHVKDAARMIVSNLDSDVRGIFNLAGENVKIIDLAHRMKCVFPSLIVNLTPMKFEDSRNYRVSTEKSRKILRFRPVHSIERGVNEIKELLETRRIKDIANPRYSNVKWLKVENGL
jgi:nucleoside-diphosphate-sugar epimerase